MQILIGLGGADLVEPGKRLLAQVVSRKQAMGAQLLGASGVRDAAVAMLPLARKNPRDKTLRFALAQAFGQLGDPQAAVCLRRWASERAAVSVTGKPLPTAITVRLSRLSLCLVGDWTQLEDVLVDCDQMLKERTLAAHDLRVMWQYWSVGQRKIKRREFALILEYVGMTDLLFARMKTVQRTELARWLSDHPDSGVLDLVYGKLAQTITPQNAQEHLGLLGIPSPEFREELARALVGAGGATIKTEVLKFVRKDLQSSDWQTKAAAVSLVDLLPVEQRHSVLQTALSNDSAYVVEEALRTMSRLGMTLTAGDIIALDSGVKGHATLDPRIRHWLGNMTREQRFAVDPDSHQP